MDSNEKKTGYTHLQLFFLQFCFGIPLGFWMSKYPDSFKGFLLSLDKYGAPILVGILFTIGIFILFKICPIEKKS